MLVIPQYIAIATLVPNTSCLIKYVHEDIKISYCVNDELPQINRMVTLILCQFAILVYTVRCSIVECTELQA